mgnify:FL=1
MKTLNFYQTTRIWKIGTKIRGDKWQLDRIDEIITLPSMPGQDPSFEGTEPFTKGDCSIGRQVIMNKRI